MLRLPRPDIAFAKSWRLRANVNARISRQLSRRWRERIIIMCLGRSFESDESFVILVNSLDSQPRHRNVIPSRPSLYKSTSRLHNNWRPRRSLRLLCASLRLVSSRSFLPLPRSQLWNNSLLPWESCFCCKYGCLLLNRYLCIVFTSFLLRASFHFRFLRSSRDRTISLIIIERQTSRENRAVQRMDTFPVHLTVKLERS